MKKLLFFSLMSLLSSLSLAQSVYYDEGAATICAKQTYDSDKRTCLAQIKDHHFNKNAVGVCAKLAYDSDKRTCLSQTQDKRFDDHVIDICANLAYDSDKRSCLKSIEDKQFLSTVEIQMCRNSAYDSDKRSCLQRASTKPFAAGGLGDDFNEPVTLSSVSVEITNALNAMRAQNFGRAEAILQTLKFRLDVLEAQGVR